MDENVTHTDDPIPWNLGILVSELPRNAIGCLTNDLKMVNHSDLLLLIIGKIVNVTNGIAPDLLDRFQNIQ